MKFRIGDTVIVNAGKDKGKSGSITKIFQKTGRVLVDGLNKKIKHVKGRDGQAGERVEFFSPMEISNVSIQDPKTKKPSRVGYKVDENGNKVRFSKASGEVLVSSAGKKEKAKKIVKA